ncbi:hypothetical protein BJV77DRAFT_496364 [Russula vinacea]|nr:hypothetical protein BJV77DRAFT_496364 [Russula vinacea]
MVCKQSSLLLHLNRHIDKGMACTYDGIFTVEASRRLGAKNGLPDCDERFSRIQDLAEHEKSEHVDDEPPPSAVPRPPKLGSLVALPQTVPSYTTTTRPASMPSITAERHARLGPWTLGMIVGHPAAGSGGIDAALRVRRTTRLTDKALKIVPTPMLPSAGDSGEINPTRDFLGQSAEYDILEEPSVASSRVFGELDMVDVTREFYEGSWGNARGGTPLSRTDSDSMLVEALL